MSATGQSRCPLPGRPGARRDNRDPSARRRHRLSAPPATPRPTPGCVAWRYPPVRPDQRLRPAACAPVCWPGGSVPGSSARSRHAPPPSPPGSAPPAPRPRDAGRQARHRGGLAAANKLDVLRFSQHRQFADTLTRVLADRLQQVAPVCRQTLHRRSLEQAGRVDQRRAQRVTAFIGIQSQVELRRRARPLQRLHSQPRQLQSLALTRVLVGCTSPGTMGCGSDSAAAATPPPVARTAGPDGPALPVRYV